MEYDLGQAVTLYIDNIKNASGQLTDPADLTLTIRHPDGTLTIVPIGGLVHVSAGHYRYELTPSAPADAGEWWYRFEAQDPDTAGEDSFTVRRSVVLGGQAPTPMSAGTCSPWAEVTDTCAPCNDYSFDPDTIGESLQFASDVLFNLTGRRWPGECTETLRPCGYGTAQTAPLPPRHGSMLTNGYGGGYANGYIDARWCGCASSRSCGCHRPSEVRLPGYPVRSIQQVKIDGDIVSAARYRVDDHRWLVYLPESPSAIRHGWPCCQRVDLADTEDDTWSITYTYGMAPPVGGVKAAAALACQLALACNPDTVAECRLPKRVTTVTRQGVSLAILDPLTLFANGQTGIAEVDLWVESIRKGDSRRRASVHVPGGGQRHRRTGR